MTAILHAALPGQQPGFRATQAALRGLVLCMRTDIVTGRTVDQLRYHHEIVRDLSWHPTEPMLVTTSFDGSVVQWEPRRMLEDSDSDEDASAASSRPIRRRALPDDPGDDRLEDFY